VSAVPDEQTAEVGGLQNTLTNLGASIGTALAGAVLISALSNSFLSGIEANPAVPNDVAAQAQIELSGGVPFISDDQLSGALADAGVEARTADAIIEDNEQSRLTGLRVSLSVLAMIALIALFFSSRIPTRQPGAEP
jgi:glycerol uptake facilitator-like aquaporin